MTKLAAYILSVLSLSLLVCGCNSSSKHDNVPKEDKRAKSMLEGIWTDADVGNVVFMVKGDTVYYPDSTLQPVEFRPSVLCRTEAGCLRLFELFSASGIPECRQRLSRETRARETRAREARAREARAREARARKTVTGWE